MPVIDVSRQLRSRADQEALVRAIADSPPDEQETYYLEWKGPLTLVGNAAGRAAVAKAVLGFANRDPAEASRAFGGCAYLLAGVSPGDLCGVEVVDAAKLEAQVATYAGRTIGWRADYVAIEERSVLIVTVEPPQWGDPIHPVRKTFNSSDTRGPVLQEGTVFVRHQASTERATAADLDMLSRRAARRPGDQLEIELRPAPGTALHRIELETESIERYIARVESGLLSSLPVEPRAASALALPYAQNALLRLAGLGLDGEYRTEGEFREAVGDHVEKLRRTLPSVLRARAILRGAAHLRLEVVNNTDTTFTKVRVEAKLAPGVWVTEWQDEVRDKAEPPEPPALYGRGRSEVDYFSALPIPSFAAIGARALANAWRPDLKRRADAFAVDYVPEDVRAKGVTPLPSLWLLLDDSSIDEVVVHWEATATNAARRPTGTLTIPIEEPPLRIEELLLADLDDNA